MSHLDIVEISKDPLPSLDFVTELVQDDGAGAITTFSGTTRNVFQGTLFRSLSFIYKLSEIEY